MSDKFQHKHTHKNNNFHHNQLKAAKIYVLGKKNRKQGVQILLAVQKCNRIFNN